MSKDIFNGRKFSVIDNYKIWVSIFMTLGILLRLFHYFYNRSLWMDEVYLSSSLVNMDFHELINNQLDYQQKAPLGFLLAVKTILLVLGNGEMALRLFSLVSGIVSLFIFIPVARYFTSKRGVIIGLGIMAFAPALVFHSVEIKQYQTEMLTTLLVFYSYIRYHDSESYNDALAWGIIGALIIWFSYSSIFILLGIAAASTIYRFFSKDRKFKLIELAAFSLWIFSFLLNFLLFTHKHAESKWIVYWFDYYRTFMPFPPISTIDFKWFPLTLYHLLDYPLGLIWRFYTGSFSILTSVLKLSAVLSLILLFSGLCSFYKRKQLLLLLCSPLILVFIASGLKFYPLTERFWVFVSPVFIILIANGCVWLSNILELKFIGTSIRVLLLLGPFVNSMVYLAQPEEFLLHKRSFQREALEFVNKNFRPGDEIYIYWNDLPGFRLYQKIADFKFKAIEGKDHRYASADYTDYLNKLKIDFKAFNGKKRVWILHNDYYRTDIGDKIDEPKWYYLKDQAPVDRMISYFSTLGEQKEVFKSFDVKINLITLGR